MRKNGDEEENSEATLAVFGIPIEQRNSRSS